jgi:hypothetical protein
MPILRNPKTWTLQFQDPHIPLIAVEGDGAFLDHLSDHGFA